MTRGRTFGALVAALVLPVVATAQGANAKPDTGSPTAERLPIYVIDGTNQRVWILRRKDLAILDRSVNLDARPASSSGRT